MSFAETLKTETFNTGKRQSELRRVQLTPIPDLMKIPGTYNLDMNGKSIGTVDVNRMNESTYVSLTLETFLSIDQFINLMEKLRKCFNLSQDQKISIQQL